MALRPSSNKKLFPVHRPGGLKRAYLNSFCSSFQKLFFYFTTPLVHSSSKKLKLGKKKKKILTSRLAVFFPPGPQETSFYSRVASVSPADRKRLDSRLVLGPIGSYQRLIYIGWVSRGQILDTPHWMASGI